MSLVGDKYSLFISDLHLCSSRPAITKLFIGFLQTTAAKAEALYILGDLFEYWAGDDDLNDSLHSRIVTALNALNQHLHRIIYRVQQGGLRLTQTHLIRTLRRFAP